MSHMLYKVTSSDILFDGANNIMNPDELILAMNEGVTFWTESKIDDPKMKLMYRIFNNRSL